jgi:hypothetical protein
VAIYHLSYVVCDECETPAQPGDDATDARNIAASEGFVRKGKRDLCRKCRPAPAPEIR